VAALCRCCATHLACVRAASPVPCGTLLPTGRYIMKGRGGCRAVKAAGIGKVELTIEVHTASLFRPFWAGPAVVVVRRAVVGQASACVGTSRIADPLGASRPEPFQSGQSELLRSKRFVIAASSRSPNGGIALRDRPASVTPPRTRYNRSQRVPHKSVPRLEQFDETNGDGKVRIRTPIGTNQTGTVTEGG
jgi:hypothetical protein